MVGFEVVGRHGSLGVVDAVSDRPAADGTADLIVLGGISSLLRFHVPIRCVRVVSLTALALQIEADVADFVPHSSRDGAIDLFLREAHPER